MALINRISRLFKADMHAVLDQIEEPESLLKQAIRDMEDDLASTEQSIRICAHDQDVLTHRRAELENTVAGFASQLDLCFESNKDDLAKHTIRKKLETERLLKRLNAKYAANAKCLAEQRTLFEQNNATLDGLRQKADLFSQRVLPGGDGQSDFDDIAWTSRELSVGDDEVEIAFLREKNLRNAS
jgi:phage shock protein A